MTALEVIFPDRPTGSTNAVDTVAELRALDSSDLTESTNVLVANSGSYKWDADSVASDDGADIIKPDDKTSLQAGRWVRVLTDAGPLEDMLDSIISLDPDDIIPVTASTTLSSSAINRAVSVTSAGTTLQLDMPPTTAANIGDAVLVIIDPACTALVDCRAYPGSGNLFGGSANRIMHAGETALVRFNGTDWVKITGNTRPFGGVIEMLDDDDEVALYWGDDGSTWFRIPLTSRQADNEPSHPWFDTDHIKIPRPGQYDFFAEYWFNNITPLADMGAVDPGIAGAYDSSAAATNFRRKWVFAGSDFDTCDAAWSAFLGANAHVGTTVRLASSDLDQVTLCWITGGQIRTRLRFIETPEW